MEPLYPLDVEPRPVVAWFAQLVELALRRNDHKPGWRGHQPDFLAHLASVRLADEAEELLDALEAWDGSPGGAALVVAEAADVAAIAMMVADIVTGKTFDGFLEPVASLLAGLPGRDPWSGRPGTAEGDNAHLRAVLGILLASMEPGTPAHRMTTAALAGQWDAARAAGAAMPFVLLKSLRSVPGENLEGPC